MDQRWLLFMNSFAFNSRTPLRYWILVLFLVRAASWKSYLKYFLRSMRMALEISGSAWFSQTFWNKLNFIYLLSLGIFSTKNSNNLFTLKSNFNRSFRIITSVGSFFIALMKSFIIIAFIFLFKRLLCPSYSSFLSSSSFILSLAPLFISYSSQIRPEFKEFWRTPSGQGTGWQN